MVIVSALRLGRGFGRLLWGGAVDLQLRHREVALWFAGAPVYALLETAVYPPASYAMLWPFLGWLPLSVSRGLWALTSAAALAWLCGLVMRESGARTRPDRAWLALLPVAVYPTQVAIGLGQLSVPVLAPLVAGILGVRRPAGWRRDVGIAALVKPSLSAPFVWIPFCLPTGLRPTLVASGAYVGVTLFAASFQDAPLASLLTAWLARGAAEAVRNPWSHTNAHEWLGLLGLGRWTLVASAILLAALGIWTWRHRRVDVWLLLGVAALVARGWTYHLLYDDVLILLPLVALWRLARRGPPGGGSDPVAGGLLVLTSLAMLAPGRLLFVAPPWRWAVRAGYAVLWAAMLVVLARAAHGERGRAATA